MHHPTLFRCLTVLGLSACTTTGTDPAEPVGPEPSGLGMGELASTPDSDSGPRFVAEADRWCEVWIDTHGRALEPTPSFLQAWNLVAATGQTSLRYVAASPLTEEDARVRICGSANCTVEQPKIFQATAGGGPHGRAGMRAGFGVIVPSKRGALVVPVAGTDGNCTPPPDLRVSQSGSLVHVTALVHLGDYARYYYHHGYEGPGRAGYGGCQITSTTRTDIVVDVENAQLELVLTQANSVVDVRLAPRGVELHGCSDVLELAWTG